MREGRRRGFASQVKEISLEGGKIPDLEGEILFTTGELKVIDGARDDKFNLIAKGQPLLERKVEVCCWEETEMPVAKRCGDTVQTKIEYHYNKVWKHKTIDSDKFNDKQRINRDKDLQNGYYNCNKVKLGHLTIDMSSIIALGWMYGRSQYK